MTDTLAVDRHVDQDARAIQGGTAKHGIGDAGRIEPPFPVAPVIEMQQRKLHEIDGLGNAFAPRQVKLADAATKAKGQAKGEAAEVVVVSVLPETTSA